MSKDDIKPFHIIIVGSGLVGLNAALIFESLSATLAGSRDVRFTVLESHHSITPYIGSLLGFYPWTFRFYDQLGLLPALQPILDESKRTVFFRNDNGAPLFTEVGLADFVEQRHGYGNRICHRPTFAEFLYRSLSDAGKKNVLLNKRVVDVEVEEDGVKVLCADGHTVQGDLVIGADGVRSKVRTCMQRRKAAAEGTKPADAADEEKSPYLAGFRMCFGNAPVLPGLALNTNWEGASDGVSTQILTGTRQVWWAIYEQPETPTRERTRYIDADKQAFLERRAGLHMAPGYTLRDVLEHDSGTVGLINLEEGLVDDWTWKRIVLVGDAVRKVEPHAGLGFNSGLADIITVANKLHGLLSAPGSAPPSTDDLERAFAEYQAERMKDMPVLDGACRRRARQVTWTNWKYRIYATWVLPYVPVARLGMKYILGPIVAGTPVLIWLEENNLPEHEVEYKHYGANAEDKSRTAAARGSSSYAARVGTAAGLLAVLAAVGYRYYPRLG